MKITVVETIEHSADITAQLVEAYLGRHRWPIRSEGRGWVLLRSPNERAVYLSRYAARDYEIHDAIAKIAAEEQRQLHEVLYDIARGA